MKSIIEVGSILLTLLVLQEANAIKWANLRITFGDRSKLSNAYERMPQSIFEALKEGWKAVDNFDCRNGGLFNGIRLIYQNDLAYLLLFSDLENLVGSQMNFIVDELKETPNVYEFDKMPSFVKNTILGKDVYSRTAYFVDPETICNGNSRKVFDSDESENELYFQQGQTPMSFYRVPLTRKEALATQWSKSRCYYSMGYHSYYALNTADPTNCTKLYPFSLLFNDEEDRNGELIGFVYCGIGHCTSTRTETLSKEAIYGLLGSDAPQCLLRAPGSSGICQVHNWFIDKPWEYHCPK